MPARVLQSTSSSGNTTATTGLKNIDATVAQGMLQFTNTGILTVVVPAGQEFVTGTGVHIKVPNDVNVPGAQDGQNGIVTAPAIAVAPGAAGNIAAFALNTKFSAQIAIQNPNAFSGGADAQVVHIVVQADIDRVLTDLRTKLTQQVGQQLQNQLAPDEVMAGKPSYSETSQASTPPVNTQADQVQVTLKVQESVPVYKPLVAVQIAATLLDNKANHNPGANLRRVGDITKVADPSVSDVKNNTLILSVIVHGTWVYNFSTTQTDQWRQAIKGLTPAAAQSYLKGQKGISDVHVDLAFGSDHLPSTVGDIKIEFTS